jgi:hypothetical protein
MPVSPAFTGAFPLPRPIMAIAVATRRVRAAETRRLPQAGERTTTTVYHATTGKLDSLVTQSVTGSATVTLTREQYHYRAAPTPTNWTTGRLCRPCRTIPPLRIAGVLVPEEVLFGLSGLPAFRRMHGKGILRDRFGFTPGGGRTGLQ